MSIITKTDSYKLGHWMQYPADTEVVYSYFESRVGARFPYTVFFGLQPILKQYLVGQVVTERDVHDADLLATAHFGTDTIFNYDGWMHIVRHHDGRLPLRIKAVPEGMPVPVSNVMMTVENTDPACYWLTNALESKLTHVWYPSTVATLSRVVKEKLKHYLELTGSSRDLLPFKLHDFGYRGVSSEESAAIGGAAHLVNFMGTDTVPAIQFLHDFYGAPYNEIAYSVPATEHSVMTSYGKPGESNMVRRALKAYPTGILSVVADSYDIYNFVTAYVCGEFKPDILARDGVFVVRPDSVASDQDTPAAQIVWILQTLWASYGGTTNASGYRLLDPHVRVLWGDGLDMDGIESILKAVVDAKFQTDNIATFGMGGGLLQKVNRDTQRFAFKCSAQRRSGMWFDTWKQPRDASKASKRGRLALIKSDTGFTTINTGDLLPTMAYGLNDLMEVVFENGELKREYTLAEVRRNAAL